MARISVIVPAYNAGGYIKSCVESILAQTYTDWELILVDDGSTDLTAEICDGYAASDVRIRAVHQENSGVSAARNNGLDMATGEIIAFADADDTLLPDAYAKMTTLIDQTGAKTAACANFLTYTDGAPALYEAPPLAEGFYDANEAMKSVTLPLLCDRLSPAPLNGYVWRYLFDREIIEKNAIRFVGKYLEDELFLIEYFCCGASLAVTGEALYNYLQNAASVTKKFLPAFSSTFLVSLLKKERLVSRYDIPVTDFWRENTCWAGLLIAVSNEFAPGNPASFTDKTEHIRALCAIPEFAAALRGYDPAELRGNKALVASLLKKRAYMPLAVLYAGKNFLRRT